MTRFASGLNQGQGNETNSTLNSGVVSSAFDKFAQKNQAKKLQSGHALN